MNTNAHTSLSFLNWMQHFQQNIETALDIYLPPITKIPSEYLHHAMRYITLNGGKRLRPLLVYATGEMFGASTKLLTRAAVAVELIHIYSLVHDDMPCMDNSTLRHGKATIHIRYNEPTALLVGDALQAQAFSILAKINRPTQIAKQLQMISILAQAAGSFGMCGGQAIDLNSIGLKLPLKKLKKMHQLKTGSLLRAAVLLGAYSGKLILSNIEKSTLNIYSNAIGLAFQIVDDILDVTTNSMILGKIPGQDSIKYKPTYVSILGLQKSKMLAEKLCLDAHKALYFFKKRASRLHDLTDLIIKRQI